MSKEESEFLGKDVRTLFKAGSSIVVAVPKEYLDEHNLKAGDKLDVYFDEVLHMEPIRREEILKKIKGKGGEK